MNELAAAVIGAGLGFGAGLIFGARVGYRDIQRQLAALRKRMDAR